MNIDEILEKQRLYFQSGATLSVDFRIEMLKKLRNVITKYEKEIAWTFSLLSSCSDSNGGMHKEK